MWCGIGRSVAPGVIKHFANGGCEMSIQTIKHNFKLGRMDLSEIDWLIKTVEIQQKEIDRLFEDNQKLRHQIHVFKAKTTWRVYEENLKLAQELALLKGEISG